MNKRIRAVSPATPPAAVIAPAGRAYAAEAGDCDPAYTKTVRGSKEAGERPKHDTKDRKSPEQMADGPDTGYGAPFEAAIWEVRAGTGARSPAENGIPAAINRITYGTAGDEGTRIVHGGGGPRRPGCRLSRGRRHPPGRGGMSCHGRSGLQAGPD